jgi:hypothetical protein
VSTVQTSHYCATCGRQTLHTKERVNHILHLILSVLTAGLWIPVWIFLGATNSAERTRCSVCGSKPGLGTLKHNAREAFGTSSHTPTADNEIPPSTWLPPGARPPKEAGR